MDPKDLIWAENPENSAFTILREQPLATEVLRNVIELLRFVKETLAFVTYDGMDKTTIALGILEFRNKPERYPIQHRALEMIYDNRVMKCIWDAFKNCNVSKSEGEEIMKIREVLMMYGVSETIDDAKRKS